MKTRHLKLITMLLLPALLLAACYYPSPDTNDGWAVTTRGSVDSVSFRATHHYWRNYNFAVSADSLVLLSQKPGEADWSGERTDSVSIRHKEPLVVADVVYVPADSIDSVWVKVARDQLTQGWVRESLLLRSAVPDDPISRFIHRFSGSKMLFALICLGIALLLLLIQAYRRKRISIVHFHDIRSFYPTLLCLTVSGSAALYGSVQHFVPSTWTEFYFHPTLNPFGLPFILSLFITSIWVMVIVAIAVIDDLRHQPDMGNGIAYVAGLAGVCTVLYLFFSLSVQIYIGYPLLLLYWAFALHMHRKNNRVDYLCGNCGEPISGKGRCPHCGAMNEG